MSEKLTRTQQRVMEWLRGGHHAHRRYGSVVYVNGGKLCTAATMLALEYKGLVKRLSNDEWIATEAGKTGK